MNCVSLRKFPRLYKKRTTAVFFIKYLRTLGFTVTNDIFAENAWYFRNALVRANYTNLQKGIHETTEYLEVFLRSLLLNEKNELHNRNLHISRNSGEEKMNIAKKKVDMEKGSIDSENKIKRCYHYQGRNMTIQRFFPFCLVKKYMFDGIPRFYAEVYAFL